MRKLFLFTAALFGSVAMWAADFSAEAPNGQTLYYNITDNENLKCEVTYGDGSYTSTIAGDLVIPATVEYDAKTYTVVGIGNSAFKDCSNLTSVTFPTAATFDHIGDGSYAFSFQNCYGIHSLTIPNNVKFLGEQAFRGMGITDITFGSGVTAIPEGLFGWCTSLSRMVFPNTITSIGADCFQSTYVKYVELGNAIADGFVAASLGSNDYWWSVTQIDTVVINTVTPPTVSGSFYSDLLNRAILYVPVGSKDAYKAADGWKDFKYILEIGETLPIYNITVSGGYSSLEQVSFSLDGAAASSKNFSFKRTVGEEFTIQVNFGNPYYGIKQVMYGETDVTAEFDSENKATLTVTADATLTFSYEQKIHPYDFTEVVPSGQTLYFKIIDAVNHKVAICNQTGGRSLWGTIDDAYDSNTTAPSGDLVIPASITHSEVVYAIEEIDTLAFCACTGITSLVIPEGIKAIRGGAFCCQYGTSLGNGEELVIPESCTRIEVRGFQGCNYASLNPGGAQVIEQYAFVNNPFTEIKASSATQELHGNLCGRNTLKTVGIGENVEFVSSEAFHSCSGIETVTILATTPPAVKYDISSSYESDSWISFDPSDKTLYVPKSEGSTVKAAYEAANCWKLFGTIAEIEDSPTAITATAADTKAVKRIVNGQLLIERDGRTFNALGAEVK